MADVLKLKITTPQGDIYSGKALQVQLETVDGQVDILPKHVCYVTVLAKGDVIVDTEQGEEKHFTISGGVASCQADLVSVLADGIA
jgi:F-type H+-transporting ATPase subunit epsilon